MTPRPRLYTWLSLAIVSSFSGCGGSAESGNHEGTGGQAGAGGQSTGGVTAAGGALAGGAMSTGGVSSSGAPGGGCCLGLAVCTDGDKQLAVDEPCPTGFECYTNTFCCSTAWCAHWRTQCTAVPLCDAGDPQLMGACPANQSCYSRSACGTTIYCLSSLGTGGARGSGGAPGSGGVSGSAGDAGAAGASCDPANEPDRKYVATNPRSCLLIDYSCPANTKYFGNDCGCGCEQDASCPDYVDCMPGPQPANPLCSEPQAARCPYTVRAL